MVDMNMAVARNVLEQLKKNNKKQVELAEAIGVSKATVSKMLSGARMISVPELLKIADYFHVSMDELVRVEAVTEQPNVIRAFMGKVDSDAARQAIEYADKIADLIIFHAKTRENADAMRESWDI